MQKSSSFTRVVFFIIVIIVAWVLLLDRLLPEGMFLDGVTYASISRNLAIGKGSFWALDFRGETIFSEHPPLMFGIQSLFFSVLGDHYLTEKVYCFILWLITAIIFQRLWKTSLDDDYRKYSVAYPLLIWILAPTVLWSFSNNILDTTMALFDLIAVLLVYQACKQKKHHYIQVALAALFTFFALLTKGPVGAFPLATPFLYYVIHHTRDRKLLLSGFIYSAIMTIIVAVIFYLLQLYPPASEHFARYINQQVLAALHGEREITTGALGRWYLLVELLTNLIPAIAISLIIYFLARFSKAGISLSISRRKALFFLLVAASASVPMLVSVKQRSFYLVPSMPYYIMSISLMVYPYYIAITDKWKVGQKSFNRFKVVAVIAILGLSFYLSTKIGKTGRDQEVIADIKQLSTIIPKGSRMGMCDATEYEYGFMSYMQRINRMEKSANIFESEYALVYREICDEDFVRLLKEMGYEQVGDELPKFSVYKRSFPLHFDFMVLNPAFRRGDI